jgi:hypothetical protein
MCTQPNLGLRRFNSTIAVMSSAEGPLGPGFRRSKEEKKEQVVFPIDQRLVEFEQRCRLDERAKFRDPAGAQEQRGQPDQKTIEDGQIRRAMSGAITDQELMLE